LKSERGAQDRQQYRQAAGALAHGKRNLTETPHQKHERIIAGWTRILGIVTILSLVMLYRTDETSRLRDRAFVYFGDPQSRPYPDANPIIWAFSIKFRNAGNMPASRVAVRVACPDAPFIDDVSDSFRLAADWITAQIASVIGPK
jgi:hypothetical protein